LFTRRKDSLGNGRDHITSPFNSYGIANADVFSCHFIGIVKRRPADGHTADFHGRE
jgi:hypothetical protein